MGLFSTFCQYLAVPGCTWLCLDLPWPVSDNHRVVLNAQTFKWMDKIGSLNAGLLCSANNLMTILTMMMFTSSRIFDVELLTFPSFPNKLRPIQSIKDPIKYNIFLWHRIIDSLPLYLVLSLWQLFSAAWTLSYWWWCCNDNGQILVNVEGTRVALVPWFWR